MLFDKVESQLIIESPGESMHLMLNLMLGAEGSDLDVDVIDGLIDEVCLDDDQGHQNGRRNYDISMEFYPLRVSPEATQLILEVLQLSEGDISDAPIDIQ